MYKYLEHKSGFAFLVYLDLFIFDLDYWIACCYWIFWFLDIIFFQIFIFRFKGSCRFSFLFVGFMYTLNYSELGSTFSFWILHVIIHIVPDFLLVLGLKLLLCCICTTCAVILFAAPLVICLRSQETSKFGCLFFIFIYFAYMDDEHYSSFFLLSY